MTLGNLRSALCARTGVQKYFMRFCACGRSHPSDTPDDVLIAEMLDGNQGLEEEDPSWRPIIWWAWLSDDDCASKGCGGVFVAPELERKQAWHQRTFKRPLEYRTLREYRTDPISIRSARSIYAKRNKPRTDPGVAAYRSDAAMCALSSDDEAEDSD